MLWLVTWNADDYCDRGSLTKMYFNAGHPYDSNVIPVIWATFWISGCRFGSTHSVVESPALGILFFDMISEGRLLISTLWLDGRPLAYHLLAQMIVLITCCNGLARDFIYGRWRGNLMMLWRLHTLKDQDLLRICSMTDEALGVLSICYAVRIYICRPGVLMK